MIYRGVAKDDGGIAPGATGVTGVRNPDGNGLTLNRLRR